MSRSMPRAPHAHARTADHRSLKQVKQTTPRARDYFYDRYHVSLGHKRTTISLDKTLSTLMSLHLDTQPNTRSAHLAVRTWLQARLDQHNDPGRAYVSQWLQSRLVEALIGPALKQKYDAWLDSELDKRLSVDHANLTERKHRL